MAGFYVFVLMGLLTCCPSRGRCDADTMAELVELMYPRALTDTLSCATGLNVSNKRLTIK